ASTKPLSVMRLSGNGCAVMRVTNTTSVSINWRQRRGKVRNSDNPLSLVLCYSLLLRFDSGHNTRYGDLMPTYARRVSSFGTTIFTEINNLARQHNAVNLGQGMPDFDGPRE